MHTASAASAPTETQRVSLSRLNFGHKNRQQLCANCDEEVKEIATGVYPFLCSTCLDFVGSAFETHGRVAYGGEG